MGARLAWAAAGAALFLVLRWALSAWLPGAALGQVSALLSRITSQANPPAASVASAAGTLAAGVVAGAAFGARRRKDVVRRAGQQDIPPRRFFDVVAADGLTPLADPSDVPAAAAAPVRQRCPHCGQWVAEEPARATAV